MPNILLEDKRSRLLSLSKSGDNYVPWNQYKGKNRYYRRLHSRLASSVKNFNSINMNKFFRDDILDVNIDVKGETDVYVVRMSFIGTLDEIHTFLKGDSSINLDRKMITKSLTRAFNKDNVYINCTCPDFCLHKDTKIKLLSGDSVSIENMKSMFDSGEELWVYSTDEQGNFIPGKVLDVWETKKTKKYIKVTLDNDNYILTTPEHLYRLRNGEYKEVSKLSIGDSLMPLYFSYHNGYEAVKINNPVYPSKFKSVYKEVANHCLLDEISEAKSRSGEDAIAIHHKDFNKNNNYPSNLAPMGVLEHWHYHSSHIKESGVLDKFIEAGQKYNKLTSDHSTKEYEQRAKLASNTMKNYYANRTEEEIKRDSLSRSKVSKSAWERGCFNTDKWKKAAKQRGVDMHTPEINELCRQGLIKYYENLSEEEHAERFKDSSRLTKEKWEKGCFNTEKFKAARKNAFNYERTPEIENKRNITKIGNVINKIIDAGKIPSPETYEEFRTNGYPRFTKYFDSWEELSLHFNLNHKVKNIEYIELEDYEPVYDIQIEGSENFLVDAGVILHNCYRHKFWATKNNILIGDPENRPSDITNPNDTKGPGCKHISLALSDSSWLIKVSSVVYNYIKYMEEHDRRLYEKYIYPALYQKPYEDENDKQLSIFDDEDELMATDISDIEAANKAAQQRFERGKFKSNKEYDEEPIENQVEISDIQAEEE